MFRVLTKLSFIIGVTIGVLLAVLLKLNTKPSRNVQPPVTRPFQPQYYEKVFKKAGLTRQKIPFDSIRYSSQKFLLESDYLRKKINILCMILVKKSKNALAAKQTWAKTCSEVQFVNMGTEKKKLPIKRDKEQASWVILCKSLKQVPEKHEWILIVYDYTFVILENLRLLLASLNHEDKYYLGHAVKFWGTVYNMGQAGYVLSKGSVDALKQQLKGEDSCTKGLTYRNQEDYYLGKNLATLNVTVSDTRDWNDFATFHPYNLHHVFFPGENYYKFSIYPQKCCSPYSVAFQSIEGDKMYTYYYLLYTLQLFYDGNWGNKPIVKTYSDDEVWKNFLKSRNIPLNITEQQYYKEWEKLVDDPTSFMKHMKREEYFDYL